MPSGADIMLINMDMASHLSYTPRSLESLHQGEDHQQPLLLATWERNAPQKRLLTEWPATAIAGNDILSSILYTVAVCTLVAGRWTPLSLLFVSLCILLPLRKIYSELGEAIPFNGGSFNCVLLYSLTGAAGPMTVGEYDSLSSDTADNNDIHINEDRATVLLAQSQTIHSEPLLFIRPVSASNASRTFQSQMSSTMTSQSAPPAVPRKQHWNTHINHGRNSLITLPIKAPLLQSTSQLFHRPQQPQQQRNKSSFGRNLVASIAGSLGLLSYISTAVVSAATAASYGAAEFEWLQPHGFLLTIVILILLAAITVAGLRESSTVASVIFTIHCSVLTFLTVAGLISAVSHHSSTLSTNLLTDDWTVFQQSGVGHGSALVNFLCGISAGLLGITGYETSSNYIEQQRPGVYPKTLRNMWLLVTIFNPLISLCSLAVVPLRDFRSSTGNLLSLVAEVTVGPWFRRLVAADAVLALCGGALTAYIGVVGLVVRMAEEGMLPQFLLQQNRWTGTNHWIYLTFQLLTCTLFAMTGGDISSLAGVYTVSFLGVLAIAVVGCVLVRTKRRRRRRNSVFTWHIWAASCGILVGMAGQLWLKPQIFLYFATYFIPVTIASLLTLFIRNMQF